MQRTFVTIDFRCYHSTGRLMRTCADSGEVDEAGV
jgi:hypothetical protein